MNKLLKTLLLVALLAGGAVQTALAQSPQSQQFTVVINLTSACTVSAVPNVVFNYTSFQVGASTATNGAGFNVRCTNGLGYTLGLQSGAGAPTPPGTATLTGIVDDAVNLTYDLGLSAATGQTGSGAIQNFSVTGTMAAAQGGTCATATCANTAATNRIHTLIVAW
jgi:spore coat protein U-like protein